MYIDMCSGDINFYFLSFLFILFLCNFLWILLSVSNKDDDDDDDDLTTNRAEGQRFVVSNCQNTNNTAIRSSAVKKGLKLQLKMHLLALFSNFLKFNRFMSSANFGSAVTFCRFGNNSNVNSANLPASGLSKNRMQHHMYQSDSCRNTNLQ